METTQDPRECKYYNKGECEYFGFPKRCCMRIIMPPTECFYFTPKTDKK